MTIPILQMRKLRLREERTLDRGHTSVSGVAWAGIRQYGCGTTILLISSHTKELSCPVAKKISKVARWSLESMKTGDRRFESTGISFLDE